MPDYLLGFDIGGTKSAVSLGDTDGQLLRRHQIETSDPQTTLSSLLEAASEFCETADVPPIAFGVSCGSPLDRREGLILEPANLIGWQSVPVVALIHKRFPIRHNFENDADAGALAEWRWGLGGKVDDVIYMTCGTGQGAGLILGGRLHRGADTLAGEIGHVRLDADGPVGCRKAGSVEGLTSGPALAYHAIQLLRKPHDSSRLDSSDRETLTGRDVGEAAIAGDTLAREAVCLLGVQLGRACAILVDVLNPQRISLGSLAVRLGSLLIDPVREVVRAEAHAASAERCVIDAAILGERVQDLAALAAASVACD